MVNPTLGTLIASFLSLISILVMWVFVIWSIFFIPYIGYHATKASRELGVSVGAKPFRWVQLGISMLLPMVIFAVIWNTAADTEVNAALLIETWQDAGVVSVGILVVIGLLFMVNKLVPNHMVNIRVALLSFMLYTTLFLTYGWGFGLASSSMLFGILIYLMFGMSDVERLGRSIAVYDIDPELTNALGNLLTELQEAGIQQDATQVQQIGFEVKKEKVENLGRSAQIEMDEFLLEMLQARFHRLRETFDILSDELSGRLDKDIRDKIETLRKDARDLEPKALSEQTSVIMAEIESASRDVPEALKVFRDQVITAGEQYRVALERIEKRQHALTSSGSDQQGSEMDKRISAVRIFFDRLRNAIVQYPGVSFEVGDEVLRLCEPAQRHFTVAIRSGDFDKAEALLMALKRKLDKIIEARKVMDVAGSVDASNKPDALIVELKELLESCIVELAAF